MNALNVSDSEFYYVYFTKKKKTFLSQENQTLERKDRVNTRVIKIHLENKTKTLGPALQHATLGPSPGLYLVRLGGIGWLLEGEQVQARKEALGDTGLQGCDKDRCRPPPAHGA